MYQYTEFDRHFVHQRAAQYRDQLERNLAGKLGDDEFRPLRLQNGWYVQRHAPMLRIAVPYGEISARQLRQLAVIAREYDRGYGHFTTRQNLQFNWIPLVRSADVMERLAEVDMHGIQTSGNCIRNITSDALAGVAADEVVDPRPYCEVLRQWSTLHPEFAFLPRKFKIAVTGAAEDRAAIGWHDIGLQLKKNAAGEIGFAVLVGGGMGRTPIIGSLIREFLPWQQILVFIEAIVRVYNRYGRRDNAYKARIKILVKAEGQKFFDAVEEEFRHILNDDVDGSAHLIPLSELERVKASFVAARGHRRSRRRIGLAGRRQGRVRALAAAQRARPPPERLPRGDAVAQARRPGAGRRDRRADGIRRGDRRALQPRRVACHARPEPGAALGSRKRARRAVAGGEGRDLRDAEHRPADRHDRLPRRRLLRAGQRPDRCRSPQRSTNVSPTSTSRTTSATSTCTSAAASTRAATTTAATSACSASTRMARSGTRCRSAARTARRSPAPRYPAR